MWIECEINKYRLFSHRLIEAEGLEEVQTKSSFTTTFSTETEQFRQTDHTFTSKSKAVFVGNVQLWLVRSLSWGNIFENKSWSNHAFMWCWINWKREFPTGENPHEHHLKVGTLTGKVWEIVVELLQSHIKTWRMKDNILLSARNVFNYWRKMLKTCLGSTIEMKFHELVFKLSRINTTK